MNSGAQMAAVDPLALLVGLGGQKIPSSPEGMPGFGELLNMAPQPTTPTSAGGEPSTIVKSLGMDGTLQPDNMIPIVIPDDLLPLLAQAATPLSDSVATSDSRQMPQGPIMTRADVLAPNDGNGDLIYIHIQTPGHSDLFVPESTDNNGEWQEMILPMRLRTVEHRDGRIIADGEMLTAAGKDVPIRLKMQVAEKTLPELSADASASEASTQTTAGKSAAGGPAMARMLADLNAEMIVIEPAADQDMPDMVDQITGRDESSSTAAKTDGAMTPAVSTLTALTDSGAVNGASTQSPGAAPVRFYDLDPKLDQMKQNPGQRIKIQLVPSNLGKMELSIVSHRGLVTVNLAVESTQAKQAVERNLAQLEQRLASSGIKVNAVQLQVNHPTRGTMFANAHQHYYQGGYGGHGGRGSKQSPYRLPRQYRMPTPDAGFKQELVNCLA